MRKQRVWIAVCIMMTAVGVSAQTRITVSTEEVRVDVLVTEKGKPVPGLEAPDFEIFDNGVRQEIEYVKLQDKLSIDSILIFDMSQSVVGERLSDLKTAARGLLADLRKGDRAALITFNHSVSLGSPLTEDLAPIQAALERAKPFGNSSLIDASYAGLVFADARSELPLIIIFSDGIDTTSWLTGSTVLETAKRIDSVVYCIATRNQKNSTFLKGLAETTGGSLFEVEFTQNLDDIFLKILSDFRKRYLLSYRPSGVPQKGWHKLEVHVKHPDASVRTRPGYTRGASGE
jgi:VWFA-related protein